MLLRIKDIYGVIVAVLLASFAYFIHHPFPVKWIAVACITLCSWIISQTKAWENITGTIENRQHYVLALFLMSIVGVSVAAGLRYDSNLSIIPSALTSFAIFAVIIGGVEELVFRGWMYSSIHNRYASIIIPAVAHAAYKACLFLSPMIMYDLNAIALLRNTFLLGILLGISRRWSGSVWPAVAAHALFDLVIYGDAAMPWWVM